MNVFEIEHTGVPGAGTGEHFPVRRLYCIGRKYE